jgi:hypothetical protein
MNHPTPTPYKRHTNPDTTNANRDPDVLVPTKVYQFQDPVTNEIQQEPFPRGQSSRWTAQPILRWIESLVSATERFDQRGMILVNGVSLSESSPPNLIAKNPALQRQHQRNPDTKQMDWRETNINNDIPFVGEPSSWDLSYVDRQDPFAWPSTRKIYHLAAQFESLVNTSSEQMGFSDSELDDLIVSYHLLQARVEFTFNRVIDQQCNQHLFSLLPPSSQDGGGNVITPLAPDFAQGEGRHLLNTLYEETIQKMEQLVRAVQKGQYPEVSVTSKISTKYEKALVHIPKQEFSKYMTEWLRQNWTNPYPDDEGMRSMANDCGTTTKVISNWLINARTRKWRPAIEKAIEANRPSQLLLEDSLNIFDEKPLRELSWTNDSSVPQNSYPYPLPTLPNCPHPIENVGCTDDNDECDLIMKLMDQDAEEDYLEYAPNKRFKSEF